MIQRRIHTFSGVALFIGVALLADVSIAQVERGFKLIVNAANPTSSIDSESAARIFMKKKSSWEGWDQPTLPIDRPVDSPLREVFSEAVHGKSVSALNSYWQRMIFSGRSVPPDVLAGNAEVFAYLQGHPGAVAYVAPEVKLPDGLKELEIVDK